MLLGVVVSRAHTADVSFLFDAREKKLQRNDDRKVLKEILAM